MKNNRLKSILGMGFASIVQVLVNIVKVKIIAVLLGTVGVGVTSFVNNIITTILPISSLGMNQGIIKEINENIEDRKKIKSIVVTSYLTTIILSIIITLFILIIDNSISILNIDSFDKKYIYIAMFSIPFLTFNQINVALINGFKKIKILGLANIYSSIITLIVSVILTYFYGLIGAIISIFITAVITSLTYWYLGRDNEYKEIKGIREYYDFKLLKRLIKYSIVSFYTIFLSNMSILLIRKIIIKNMGFDSVGIFQADWALINQYLGLVLSSLGVYLIPTLCSLKNNKEISDELNSTLKIILLIAVPIMLCIISFGRIAIILFYSTKFLEAATILPLFVLGDILKCIAWIIGAPMWTIPKLGKLAVLNTLDFFIMVIVPYFFIGSLGLYSIVIAYILMNLVEIIFNYIVMKSELNFSFGKYNYKLIITSIGVIALSVIVEFYTKNLLFMITIQLILFLIWALLSVRKEDINMILYVLTRGRKGKLRN